MENTVDAKTRSNRLNSFATTFAFAPSESVDCVTTERALSKHRLHFTDARIGCESELSEPTRAKKCERVSRSERRRYLAA